MNILHIISSDGGGVSTYVRGLIKCLGTDHDFTVLSFSDFGKEFRDLQEENLCQLFVMPRPKEVGIRKFIKYLISFFNNQDFSFIESHIPGIHALIFKILSKSNINFSVHSHQSSLSNVNISSFKKNILLVSNPFINRIISKKGLSCGEKAETFAFGDNYNSFVIFNSVDINPRNYNNIKPINSRIEVGFFGRHTSAKNIEFILLLALDCKKNKENIRFNLYGSGELTKNIKDKIAAMDLLDIVCLKGRTNKVLLEMSSMDVNLLPSFSEGLPTTLIESQSVGLPSVVSDNITDEVDLELDMVSYLPIDRTETNFKLWREEIKRLSSKRHTYDMNTIYSKMQEKNFTLDKMIERYETYLSNFVCS